MTARNLLESIHLTHQRIGRLLRLQANLRDRLRRMCVQNPAAAERLEQQSQALAEEILALYHGLDARRARVSRIIDRLPDPDEREVLKLLYLSGLTVDAIAQVLHISPRHAYRIKARALERLQALLGPKNQL